MAAMKLLFGGDELSAALAHQTALIKKEIGGVSANHILHATDQELGDYFFDKYIVNIPNLDEENITVSHGDAQIDVRHRFEYVVHDRSQPTYVSGTRISFFVPYQGDKILFELRPSSFTFSAPHGIVREDELEFRYESTNASSIGQGFQNDLAKVKKYLGFITSDVEPFNAQIREFAIQQISSRRNKLLEDQKVVESLGYRLRQRVDSAQTYKSPKVRRRVRPTFRPSQQSLPDPHPILEVEEYDHILSVIANMAQVIERSPKMFKGMGEEELRQHFLVQLNGHYEGNATGETFNYYGKTDILIRERGKNIFVAECKFWDGPKSFSDAIDQLLDYVSWRDTKTALLIFNRNKDLSAVLNRIQSAMAEHSHLKREIAFASETGFRYVLGHPNDDAKDVYLTILVFEVPS